MLITFDGKGYALIRMYALINTGVKQKIIIVIQALIEKKLVNDAFELINKDHYFSNDANSACYNAWL